MALTIKKEPIPPTRPVICTANFTLANSSVQLSDILNSLKEQVSNTLSGKGVEFDSSKVHAVHRGSTWVDEYEMIEQGTVEFIFEYEANDDWYNKLYSKYQEKMVEYRNWQKQYKLELEALAEKQQKRELAIQEKEDKIKSDMAAKKMLIKSLTPEQRKLLGY